MHVESEIFWSIQQMSKENQNINTAAKYAVLYLIF